MEFNQLVGLNYIQTKRSNSSIEKGVILTVDPKNGYVIGKGEDGKSHFFSLQSFKEGDILSLEDEKVLGALREYLGEKDREAKNAILENRKKREEEIKAQKAMEEAKKIADRKAKAKARAKKAKKN